MNGEKGGELFRFASAEDERVLGQIAARLQKEGILDDEDVVARLVKGYRVRRPSVFEEFHPGWIRERLEGESPRVLGVICRFLPGDKIKYLLDRLTARERKLFPKVNESYKIAPDVAELVRLLVEKKLSFSLPIDAGGVFSFSHIALMRSDDLRTLFRDLGLEELRRAFSEVDSKVLKAFLARFAPPVAREIRGRIDFGVKTPPSRRREAQKHLVGISMENVSAEELLREIGYSVFVRALAAEDRPLGDYLYQKISPEEGHRLKRALSETSQSRPVDIIRSMQEEILGRIRVLADKGLIRPYWKDNKGKR